MSGMSRTPPLYLHSDHRMDRPEHMTVSTTNTGCWLPSDGRIDVEFMERGFQGYDWAGWPGIQQDAANALITAGSPDNLLFWLNLVWVHFLLLKLL